MIMAIGVAAIVAFIIIAAVIEDRINKRRSIDSFKSAWDHGHARDMSVLRQCWNLGALQARTKRSVSNVRGEL